MSSSSVTPPPSLPLTATTSGGAPAVVSVPQAPAELILLARGTPVEARVVAAPEGGQPAQLQVSVDGEPVTVAARLPLPLPVGASLILKVMPSPAGDTLNLRLAAVNGRPIAGGVADPVASVRGGALAEAPMQAAAVAPSSTVGVGRPIAATVLRGDVLPDTPKGAELLEPGTRLVLRVTQLALPEAGARAAAPGSAVPPGAPGVPATPAAPPPQGQVAAAYAAIGRIAQPAAAPNPPQAAAAPAQPAPLTGAAAPPGTPAAPPSAAPPLPGAGQAAPQGFAPLPEAPAQPALGTLTGQVIGQTALGQPTLKTAAGFVALDLRAPLPTGTQVAAEVLSRVPPEAGAPPPALFSGASPVTTLDALVQSLAAVDSGAAARVLAQLPQPGPQLLANLAAAVAAVRSGDVQGWLRLGELPPRGRDDARVGKVAQRLSDDLREAAGAAQRPAGEWRVYPLPMFAGGAVERIQMLVRRTPEPDDDEAKRNRTRGDDTRFLLDFTLSSLGPMQIDGLVSRGARSLDLVMRTHDPLPEPMPRDLQGVFAQAMQGIGYTGSLSLRVTPAFVVPEDVRPADDRPGVVV